MPTNGGPVVSLNAAWLQYVAGFELYTATSGPVPALRAVYLSIDYGDVVGRSEVRTNIGYLTGFQQDALETLIAETLTALALSSDPRVDREQLDDLLPGAPATVRLLLETALVDAAARRAECTVAAFIGQKSEPLRARTNQTLSLTDNDVLLARTSAYIARGYCDLKLRIGADEPQHDLERLRLLRDRFGDSVTLSADVNGKWDRTIARQLLPALDELELDYIEQPLPADDLEGTLALIEESSTPIMLDEAASSVADVEQIASRAAKTDGRLLVHLKLAKLGGLDRLTSAAQLLRNAGLSIMIGQMNEGVLATAAALAATIALQPERAELYGADGLLNDPFEGLTYENGAVTASGRCGFGVELSRPIGPLIAGEGNPL